MLVVEYLANQTSAATNHAENEAAGMPNEIIDEVLNKVMRVMKLKSMHAWAG